MNFVHVLFYSVLITGLAKCEHTKPMKFVGLPSGQLLLCQMDKLDTCSEFVNAHSPIHAMSLDGEYLYLGLGSGEMWRCDIYDSHCTTLNYAGIAIMAILAHGDHVYAGTKYGTMWKCKMTEKDSCIDWNQGGSAIRSLAIFGDYIYAGLESGTMWHCRIDRPDSCLTFNSAASSINSLAISGEFIYAGLQAGFLWMCNLFKEHSCEDIYSSPSGIAAIDIFDQNIHVALDSGVILRCGLINHDCWTLHDRKTKATSLENVYARTTLRTTFIDENENCEWQPAPNCPPYVVYFDVDERAALELQVKNGRIYNARGKLFDTSNADKSYTGNKAIFVMEPGGRIYASNLHPSYLIHHSSFVSGNPVSAAGELEVRKGIIKNVTTCTGQYRSTVDLTMQMIPSLARKGYHRDITITNCADLVLEMDVDYNLQEE